jgi:hypothetical protein
MTSILCNFCNYEFKNKSSLNYHQKNTKYCLEIQGKTQNNFKCDTCDKFLSSKNKLENHKQICSVKKINEQKEKDEELKEKDKLIIKLKIQNENYEKHLEEYKQQIKDLQEKLANRSTTTNNTTNNTLNIASFIDFNDIERAKNMIENNLNINHVVDGQKGLARFVKDIFLTDENGKLTYLCTDTSRHIFKYKDSEGEIKRDVEAKKLTDYILKGGIRTKSVVIGNEWCKDEDGDIDITKLEIMLEQQESIMKLSDDNNSFKKELASITIF